MDDGTDAPREMVETERKYDVPHRWRFPVPRAFAPVGRVEAHPALTQTAVYLDTPDLALLRARHTLRRRTGGRDDGWHLKRPGSGDDRTELQAPPGASGVRVPAVIRAQIADLVGAAPLVPVCRLRTVRTERTISDGDGRVLVVLADDRVEAEVLLCLGGAEPGTSGGRAGAGADADAPGGVLSTALLWREVEAELVDGSIADLDAVAEILTRSGLVPARLPSKLARAMAAPHRLVETALAVPRKKRAAGDVALAYIGAQLAVLHQQEERVRADEPDAVHKARVATRRLRSALRTYRHLFDRAAASDLRAQVRWLTGMLGEPRDAEVMRDRLAQRLHELTRLDPALVVAPAGERLTDTLRETHAQAHARLVAALDSAAYEDLMARIAQFVACPPRTPRAAEPARRLVAQFVARDIDKVTAAARVAEHAAEPAQPAEPDGPVGPVGPVEDGPDRHAALHEVRKRAKAARYALESAGENAAKGAASQVATWRDLQEALGQVQDSVVARAVLDAIRRAAYDAGEDTFTYGALAAREAQLAAGVLEGYPALLHDALAASGGRSRR